MINYDVTKGHGNIPVSSKCEYSWSNKEFCFHQNVELIENRITKEALLKRDFEEKR